MRFVANQKVYVFIAVLLLSGVIPLFSYVQISHAAQLNKRSIRIDSSVTGALTKHLFSFDTNSAPIMASIEFEYCSNSPLIGTPCTAPTGLSLSGATLNSQTGETGFILGINSANRIVITRTPGAANAQPVSYSFGNITNPTDVNKTVYVRISTFASTNATGPRTDQGAVAFSINAGLAATLYVPPFLIFCVGVTVGTNCSTSTGNSIDLGELSKTKTRSASTQFSGATNDTGGYSVTVIGSTMLSGNNVINPLVSPTSSTTGVSQFGLNLRLNTAPPNGQDSTGTGTAAALSNYDIPNKFMFKNGDILAASPLNTDFNIFTVTYIVNVDSGQQPGIYSTTLTYVGSAAF